MLLAIGLWISERTLSGLHTLTFYHFLTQLECSDLGMANLRDMEQVAENNVWRRSNVAGEYLQGMMNRAPLVIDHHC